MAVLVTLGRDQAIAIKLDDLGLVFFRQRRVGRDGELFTIVKPRTMAGGAEEHLDELLPYYERNGLLFKMEHDPGSLGWGGCCEPSASTSPPQV